MMLTPVPSDLPHAIQHVQTRACLSSMPALFRVHDVLWFVGLVAVVLLLHSEVQSLKTALGHQHERQGTVVAKLEVRPLLTGPSCVRSAGCFWFCRALRSA